MYSSEYIEIPYNELPPFQLMGSPDYTDSVYSYGIRDPVILATWNGEMSLVAGNRRILSLIAAHNKALGDGTLHDRPWLDFLKALVYHNMPPAVQAAWAIADNEERSENPLHLYSIIKAAQARRDWDEITAIYKLNPAKFDQAMKLDNLNAENMQAFVEGRMTKANALRLAKMGDRQTYVYDFAKARAAAAGKEEIRITAGDIDAGRQARASAVLNKLSGQILPVESAAAEASGMMFLVAGADILDELDERGLLYSEFKKAYEVASANNVTLYRLNEV